MSEKIYKIEIENKLTTLFVACWGVRLEEGEAEGEDEDGGEGEGGEGVGVCMLLRHY